MTRKKPSKRTRREELPYTGVFNAALSVGLTRTDLVMMPFGEMILVLQSKAEGYGEDSKVREATQAEVEAWL